MARSVPTMRPSALSRHMASLARRFRPAAAAWVMVLTVLFCAMLPAGLPLSTPHGSAFNPATTTVALAAKGPQRRLTIAQQADPGDTAQPIGLAKVLPLPAATASLEPWIAEKARLAVPDPRILRRDAARGTRRARAPPQA